MATAKPSRPYLYEVDPIRSMTALGVVGVHAVAYTMFLNTTTLGSEIQNGAVTALHFTREIFLTITAFVLIYGYMGKPFNTKTFWRKRGLGVLLPYVIWSIYYAWVNEPHKSVDSWVRGTLGDIASGNASYQLYFILLTLEFYLILPALLWFLGKYGHHPWRILGISFAVQLVVMYVDFHYVQVGPVAATGFGQLLNQYQWRVLPFYQFYILLGAVGALYLKQVRAFVLQHGRWIVAAFVAGLGLLWLRYVIQIFPDPNQQSYAISVFQPIVVLYSLSLVVFAYWLGYRWAVRKTASGLPRGFRIWRMLSDASFGIYLVHPIFLNLLVIPFVVPLLQTTWPVALTVFFVWLLTAAGSVAASTLLLYVPVLSRLVGRSTAQSLQLPSLRQPPALKQTTRVRAWRRADSRPALSATRREE
jgi:probable poly-beta-1,6-N-acetyl-D-glucosamine export protein